MFVNLERDVCNDTAGRFHIYTETSLAGCIPKECGAGDRRLEGLE
jgi:hypothetical protein